MKTEHDQHGAAWFARETTDHQLVVRHDDGLYRHLTFRAPETGLGIIHLVTWPHYLAVTGGRDGFVFFRGNCPDILTFFRGQEVNPQYWLQSVCDGRERASEYSLEAFEAFVENQIVSHEKRFPGLAAAVRQALAVDYNTEYADGAQEFLRDFRYVTTANQARLAELRSEFAALADDTAHRRQVRADAWSKMRRFVDEVTFEFDTSEPPDLTDWTWDYLWACNALAVIIRRYDESRG